MPYAYRRIMKLIRFARQNFNDLLSLFPKITQGFGGETLTLYYWKHLNLHFKNEMSLEKKLERKGMEKIKVLYRLKFG